MKNHWLMSVLMLLLSSSGVKIYAQGTEEDRAYKPLTLKINESGSKYIRFITWHQIWAENQNLEANSNVNLRIRRSRFLTYAQINKRFLIITHFGLNTLTSNNMDPIGNRSTDDNTINGPQLFLHGAWTEYKLSKGDQLYMGAGLHYWNGLSRLTSASTLNFMTLDNYRQAWATLGLSDQFARHLGIYAKGTLGKFQYSFAVNEAMENALGSAPLEDLAEGSTTYSGRRVLGDDAGLIFQGYLEYQFLDQESKKLPYRVGTYLGEKEVFNLGAGFFSHSNGSVHIENGLPIGQNVQHFAADVFYDAPVGKGALNAYAVFYNFDYGENYNLGFTYGTGNSFYSHIGYLLPEFSLKGRLMPYLAISTRDFDAFDNSGNDLRMGTNWFINGHNAKISLEYKSTLQNYNETKPQRINALVLQSHIFL